MAFAVIACSGCREPWAVDLRHRTVGCPRCARSADTARRTRLWQGDDARDARAAAATLRSRMAQGMEPEQVEAVLRAAEPEPVVRHDTPVDAAAARARGITNRSARADEVALWLTRLLGAAPHDTYLEALGKAGIDAERAEREIVRMLATDVIYEPRAGAYSSLSA